MLRRQPANTLCHGPADPWRWADQIKMKDIMNWKLRLKYGKEKTNFSHYTLLADGIVGNLLEGFNCQPGRAWMSMKAWSINQDQALDMIRVIGKDIGFTVDGRIELFVTAPEKPPKETPFGYDIRFNPYDEKSTQQE